MRVLPRPLDRLRQEAKALSRKEGVDHSRALELVARRHGFPNWKDALEAADESRAISQPISQGEFDFLGGRDDPSDGKDMFMDGRSTDLPPEVQIRIEKNKAFFASLGIEYSTFEPTATGFKKSILDATRPVRRHFESNGFHFFDEQGQGRAHKVIKIAHFVSCDAIVLTKASLYRPMTKKGDPRMWFRKLQGFAKPGDQVAIVVFQGELYLFNLNNLQLDNLCPESNSAKFIQRYSASRNSIADELLQKLREIAKKPIKAIVAGDTAVGIAIENALNISANCSKQPDYKGIEIKGGRGRKNRSTLFAQVPDWGGSLCKSSADILDKYGYQRGGDFKLYCTVSTLKANSQGLRFVYDQSLDCLIEKDREGQDVAIWPGDLLRKRLLEKHAETFWVNAISTKIDGVEYFELVSVTHTKKPLVSQLLPLIQSGVITMDHLIKRGGGAKPTVSEKGPLFKINKRDLVYLFPEPKTYSLKEGPNGASG